MKQILQDGSAKLGINLTEDKINTLILFTDLLLDWNKRMNLTAITDPKDIAVKHLLDSLAVASELPAGSKVIDVGAGAGLPGIPISIARPDLHITLLDSLGKRVSFLQHVICTLNLTNARSIHARAEYAGHDYSLRHTFDISIARAVADLAALAEFCLPFVKCDGKFISMKGPADNERLIHEINDAKKAIDTLGGQICRFKPIKIPFSDIGRSLIIVRKLTETPAKYPRKPSKIKKNPIH